MAESGLSIGLPELRKEVGYYLNYGTSGWSVDETAEIDRIIQSGVRRVYYPTALSENLAGYEWSWLRPMTTLSLVSGTYEYDMPGDFGRMVGHFHYAAEEYLRPIIEVSIGVVLNERTRANLSGDPNIFASVWKSSDGSSGQRRMVSVYPTPDSDKTVTYQYEAYQGALDATHPYPLGGMKLAELYIESCLAVAEQRMNDEVGVHKSQFDALLVDAIARDKKNGAKFYGNMGHHEDEGFEFRRGWGESTYPITYHGDTI